MTIPEIKQKWNDRSDIIKQTGISQVNSISLLLIEEFLTDLDTLPECNGKVIDYVKETCTSCGCKNHNQ